VTLILLFYRLLNVKCQLTNAKYASSYYRLISMV